MAKRRKIGIIYSYSESWIGGTYYIQNLIRALKTLKDDERPFLRIFCRNRREIGEIAKIDYPFIQFVILGKSKFVRAINRCTQVIFGRRVFDELLLWDIDALFPYQPSSSFCSVPSSKRIFWIPDLQLHFLPEYFSGPEISERTARYRKIADSQSTLILSSNSVSDDFDRFYSPYSCRVKVVPFAVTHLMVDESKWRSSKAKYGIPDVYYFVANQFWKHKNHVVIIKALKILIESGLKIYIVFSGKEEDYRNPQHVIELKNSVIESNLLPYCRFLGFIPREDQLLIMKQSKAVIQPSLFEGWSTVIEDAKALNKFVIASDIATHREQVTDHVVFFSPHNESQLAELIRKDLGTQRVIKSDYEHNIGLFARNFMNALSENGVFG